MKHLRHTTRPPQQIFAALALTSILSLGAGMTLLDTATANAVENPQSVASLKQSGANQLPRSVLIAVRRDIARTNRIPPGRLRVVSSTQQSWSDSCLGLGRPEESCAQILIENGWRIVMSDGRQNWIYRSDNTGRNVRLEAQQSPSSSNVPNSVTNAVLKVASGELKLPISQLRITQAEQQTWPDGCLGLPSPVERCIGTLTPGWRVVVAGRQQSQVYRTDETGSRIRAEGLNGQPSNTSALPAEISRAVLEDAHKRSRIPLRQLRVVQADIAEWSDGCLGLAEPDVFCTQAIVPGWKVTVVGGQQTFVYRTDSSGSVIKFEGGATQGNSGAVPMPSNEIPVPLSSNTVFRVITSGGFAGQTFETRLLENGQVIRVQTNSPNPTTQPQIHRISRQQVRQFEQLLAQTKFSQFNRLSYPAPNGAADYFTVTLTGKAGTTRYAELDLNRLPAPLQEVVQAWKQIANSR